MTAASKAEAKRRGRRSDPPTDPAPSNGTDKLAAQVARKVGDEIVAIGWPVGEVLGSEAQLMERFGVSRAVLREAVRLLEHNSVGVMRRGPAGGLVLREPDPAAAVNAIIVYLEYAGVTVENLIDARIILEPLAASYASQNVSEGAIDLLRDTLSDEAAMSNKELIAASQDLVHKAVAKLSGNPVLELFVDILVQLTSRYARTAREIGVQEVTRVADGVTHAHQAVVDAVLAGNAGLAQHRTEEHLRAMSAWLVAKYGGATTARQARIRARGRTGPARPEGVKLAEHVANQLRDEIIRRDWPVGEVLGSETELLERYQVSRAVLREAVRLLEHHSVARTRRGPGGGLVVTRPDPAASVEAMSLLLEYRHVTVDQVRTVRDALELASVVRVSERADQPEVAARLRAAVEIDPAAAENGARLTEVAQYLHWEIAALSDNPLLAVFVQILTRIWARHGARTPSSGRPLTDPEALANVQHAHAHIVEAMLKPDANLARHRMQRHLNALSEWWH